MSSMLLRQGRSPRLTCRGVQLRPRRGQLAPPLQPPLHPSPHLALRLAAAQRLCNRERVADGGLAAAQQLRAVAEEHEVGVDRADDELHERVALGQLDLWGGGRRPRGRGCVCGGKGSVSHTLRWSARPCGGRDPPPLGRHAHLPSPAVSSYRPSACCVRPPAPPRATPGAHVCELARQLKARLLLGAARQREVGVAALQHLPLHNLLQRLVLDSGVGREAARRVLRGTRGQCHCRQPATPIQYGICAMCGLVACLCTWAGRSRNSEGSCCWVLAPPCPAAPAATAMPLATRARHSPR
jgi:hypothetical protein